MSLKHMREAWGLSQNPFPPSAIGGEDSMNAPYSGAVLTEDRDQFIEKLIVKAALPPGREFGYLWSQGRRDDTGYGKTTLMLHTARELNTDFGQAIIKEFDLPSDMLMAGVWASMKLTGVTGIYALLFETIAFAAQRPSPDELCLLEKCWNAIAANAGVDPEDRSALVPTIRDEIHQTQRTLFPGYPALRNDIVEALVSCDTNVVLSRLSQVTRPSRTRNGLAYFEALYCLVRAAGVGHLFVFVDQLEDLATARNIPRATRQREVGRFRDIFAETAGLRGRCHAVFTFHNRAASALIDFWQWERLSPPFSPQDPMGRSATIVLKGLTSAAQVEALLATYLDSVREVPTGTTDPFEPSTIQVLLERCDGRIGQILSEAFVILDQAADESLPSIAGSFILDSLPGPQDSPSYTEPASDEDTLTALWNQPD